jgi:hypothetical protein
VEAGVIPCDRERPTVPAADRVRELTIETLAVAEREARARVGDLEAALRIAAGEREAYREFAYACLDALHRVTAERDGARESLRELHAQRRRFQQGDQRRAA